MRREPNPWGLYDVYGNVNEINANWYYLYPEGLEMDPSGGTNNPDENRMARGGKYLDERKWVVTSKRTECQIGRRLPGNGLRVAFPENLTIRLTSTE